MQLFAIYFTSYRYKSFSGNIRNTSKREILLNTVAFHFFFNAKYFAWRELMVQHMHIHTFLFVYSNVYRIIRIGKTQISSNLLNGP